MAVLQNPVAMAMLGTGFTFLVTALGAGMVFLVKDDIDPSMQKGFLGFASGVMMAASVWSLLIPAIDMAEEQGKLGWPPAFIGFLLGGGFLFLLDRLLPHLHPGAKTPEGTHTDSFRRSTMLVLAVTMHNIPEGMAVGLAFGLAAQGAAPLHCRRRSLWLSASGCKTSLRGRPSRCRLKKRGYQKRSRFSTVQPVALSSRWRDW